MSYFVWIRLSVESVATIREALETELQRLHEEGECEKDLIYCIMIIDTLKELPTIR